jgi:hypothetical protein
MHEMLTELVEGAIIDQRAAHLFFEDTWQSAHSRISLATDDLIAANLDSMIACTWQASPQNDAKAKYCRRRRTTCSMHQFLRLRLEVKRPEEVHWLEQRAAAKEFTARDQQYALPDPVLDRIQRTGHKDTFFGGTSTP